MGAMIRRAATLLLTVAILGIQGLLSAENVLLGVTDYDFSAPPNGSQTDTNPRSKLTDGLASWNFTQSVQWNLQIVPGNTVDVTFDLGRVEELGLFTTKWVRWDSAMAILPTSMEATFSIDGESWTSPVPLSEVVSADQTVAVYSADLDGPTPARHLRLRFQRSTSGIVSLLEVEARQVSPQGNMVIGYPYQISGPTPNVSPDNSKGRKLTDGIALSGLEHLVAWDLDLLPQDSNIAITIELDDVALVERVDGSWFHDTDSGFLPPEIANVYFRTGSDNWALAGSMTNMLPLDGALNRHSWDGGGVEADQIQVVFNRGISNTGIVALGEIAAYGTPRATPPAEEIPLAFIFTITAGSDVLFRPEGHPSRNWIDPPASAIPEITRILSQNYHANKFYVQWNGEVDDDEAIALFHAWAEACAQYQVEMVPSMGLVQWHYLESVNPAAEFPGGGFPAHGSGAYYGSPLLDIRNSDARAWFASFIDRLLTEIPSIEEVSVVDINQYAISVNVPEIGYTPTLADYAAWDDAILGGHPSISRTLIFQQPGYVCAPELENIGGRVLDTYSYLLYETFEDLHDYVAAEVACNPRVEGDLVVVTDPGDRFDPAVELLAARAIEAAGAGLSLDLIITAAVMREQRQESFWWSLLHNGNYEGYYQGAFETARQRYRFHDNRTFEPSGINGWMVLH